MTGKRFKLNSDKPEDLLVGSRRRVSVSQDNHLRVDNHESSFKGLVEDLGVYFHAILSMMKHTDHISRAAYLEIRRNSSIRHLLATKAPAQLTCSLFSGWTTAALCSLTSRVLYSQVGLLQLFAH